MQGGKKGVLVNSVSVCKVSNRAIVEMVAQDGKVYDSSLLIGAGCKKKGEK
jgi:hypothetical protein